MLQEILRFFFFYKNPIQKLEISVFLPKLKEKGNVKKVLVSLYVMHECQFAIVSRIPVIYVKASLPEIRKNSLLGSPHTNVQAPAPTSLTCSVENWIIH